MNKNTAIQLLGGTPKKAAEALCYEAVQSIYMWPEELPQSTSDRVIGAALRLNKFVLLVSQDRQANEVCKVIVSTAMGKTTA
jgi:hypothetical protein